MPHIIVKLISGKSEEQKTHLAEEITKSVINILHSKEESISIAFEEVNSKDWAEMVYRPEIQDKLHTLYKKPGYSM